MNEKKFVGMVSHKGTNYLFSAIIHAVHAPLGLQLHTHEFYERFGEKIPSGLHHEIEWEVIPKVSTSVNDRLTHVHVNSDRRFFAGWTKQIPTLEDAEKIVQMHALGVIYAMLHKVDFTQVFNEQNEDVINTIETFEKKHQLTFYLVDDEITEKALIRHAFLSQNARLN